MSHVDKRRQIRNFVVFYRLYKIIVDYISVTQWLKWKENLGDDQIMNLMEIIIVSVGLSLDVFVAVAYIGAGFSVIKKGNAAGLGVLFSLMSWHLSWAI